MGVDGRTTPRPPPIENWKPPYKCSRRYLQLL